MDKIKLNGLRFYGYHGLLPEENKLGQNFVVSLILECDLSEACRADDLQKTIDYRSAIETVEKVVTGPPMRLIESVAEAIAQEILKGHSRLRRITVQLLKPNPPLPYAFDGVSVELTRNNPVSSENKARL